MRLRTTTISILAVGLLAGSAVGVAAQDEEAASPMAPAVFKCTVGAPTDVLESTVNPTELGESVTNKGVIDSAFEAGDARAAGLFTAVQNEEYVGRVGVVSGQARIVNDAGTWSGPATGVLRLKKNPSNDGLPMNRFTSIAVLTGDGAYEGLTLILTQTLDESLCYIIPTDLVPPVPELPA